MLDDKLAKADRLAAVTQKIGFALWQFQELEGVSAQYFVLLAQASQGMGWSEGMTLVEKAQSGTFGATIRRLAEAELLSNEMEIAFREVLAERNWLVHRSRADSRNVVYSDHAMDKLVSRLSTMADGALRLLKQLGSLTDAHVKKHGVTEEFIELATADLIAQWHQSETV